MIAFDRLNFHHLRYFWTVARAGSIAKACARLLVSQPTISGQLRELERALGTRLFTRNGRFLQLTDTGRLVADHADQIFAVSRELTDALAGRAVGRPVTVTVGISDELPKLVAYRLLEPALGMPEPVRLICREDTPERLLAALSVHELDLVLSDEPLDARYSVRGYNHLLGSSGVGFFAATRLAGLRRGFPASLTDQPMLLPVAGSQLRRSLDGWFERHGLRPRVVAEIQDSALAQAFGQAGAGVFSGPAALADEIARQYQVELIGHTDEVQERYYAISIERRLSNPAVLAISRAARRLFETPVRRRPGTRAGRSTGQPRPRSHAARPPGTP